MALELNFENGYRGVLLQAYDNLSGPELADISVQI